MYVTHLLYPFICHWTFSLLYLGVFSTKCSAFYTRFCVLIWFGFTQQSQKLLLKELPHSFRWLSGSQRAGIAELPEPDPTDGFSVLPVSG